MPVTLNNSQPRRKQLSDQLDRLDAQMSRQDTILDALSEGLNGAVADAAREGTRLAIKDAIVEILTNPDLRTAMHGATTPAPDARPSFWQRLKATVRAGAEKVKRTVQSIGSVVRAKVVATYRIVVSSTTAVRLAWHLHKVAIVTLGLGATLLAVVCGMPDRVSAGIGIIRETAVSVVTWIGERLRRIPARLSFA